MAQEGALGGLRGSLSSFEDLSLIETDTFITETRLCVMDGGSTIITGVEHDRCAKQARPSKRTSADLSSREILGTNVK